MQPAATRFGSKRVILPAAAVSAATVRLADSDRGGAEDGWQVLFASSGDRSEQP